MNEKPVKVDIAFDEALRRIAHTPKSVVPITHKESKKAATLTKKVATKPKSTK